ncbi:hypothetical protein JAAARDRAFT_70670 [Jaapia argillacea MUCL 33604]|uniref:ubiquitinyl hydrolase 1 n=1 Tax=Jaapia argillacea MUCL 33604 TaxID=933084 RepID=A0A067PRC0_9AGAM|nr:hypothetical protein JAAARDRAFT_70670 [Jaapia argillacea MUCL 33604]
MPVVSYINGTRAFARQLSIMPNVPKTLMYIIHHVFIPMKLPQEDDHDASNDFALCDQTLRCAIEYKELLSPDLQERWTPIVKMLENLTSAHKLRALAADDVSSSIAGMQPGDTLAFFIRAQNAGLLVRKFVDRTAFESFEVSAPNEKVMETKGKLLCSYPGPAIGVRREIVEESSFLKELSSFLAHMDVDILDSAPTTDKAGSAVIETRDTTHPRYITQLLTGILRGIGEPEERIADDILWDNAKLPWRRSPLWLVIRVALQTSLHRESNSHTQYKSFMLYLMSTILRRSSEKGLPSDLLFCMRAKLSRRLSKLGSSTPQFVVSEVEQSVEWTQTLLQNRWEAVQRRQEASPPWCPKDLDLIADTHISLDNSRDYISKILRQDSIDPSSTSFEPNEFPRFQSLNHSSFATAFEENTFIALADFELAVEIGIDDWVARHLDVKADEAACTTVSKWIDEYSSAAKKLYDSNPEDWSVMLLTLFELWVALDRLSVAQCPLLEDYSPEISVDLLEPLLLRKAMSTARLVAIVKYLRGRHERSRPGWSVFATTMSRDSFAVRYFETSREHQLLKSRIEMDATVEKGAKLRELEEMNAQYRRLTTEARSLSHQYHYDCWARRTRHSGNCEKCALEREAAELRIKVHEWPLSRNLFEARATVFELACPLVFRTWRDTTYSLLRESCMHQRLSQSDSEAKIEIADYVGLQDYIQARTNVGRITLASTTKSFLNSHYQDHALPSTADATCLNNGLSWVLFDTISESFIDAPFAGCDTTPGCTLQLPLDGPYTDLQYSVTGTLHTSNQVIANQADCSRDLNLHEYIAFATLRSGHRLQWPNILRELLSRCLSFHREEVHLLMMQTAWQIGPLSNDDVWESHAELGSVKFARALLDQLQDLLRTIEANWAELASMRTVIALTCRLLASTTDPVIASTGYKLLRAARNATLAWIRRLTDMAQHSESENQEVLLRLCEAAATCRSSYDVGVCHILPLLISPEDVAIALECGIIVHDNTPPQSNMSADLKRILARDHRLAHFLEPHLSLRIGQDRAGIDKAIHSLWSDYQPGTNWRRRSPPEDRWFSSSTEGSAKGRPQHVDLDILAGQMLIDGKPLGRLPPVIINHPTYRRIFGQKVFHVVPSKLPEFDYATRSSVFDHQVNFTLRDGTHLVIRAEHDSRLLELIPHEVITGDFPKLLVQDYAHWMDVSTGEIEFRPLQNPWDSATKEWTMIFCVDHPLILKTATSIRLIDIRSPSFAMISACLEPLEYKEYLMPTCNSVGESLVIDLPRFRLSFSLNTHGNLECQNLPGMVIDPNQSTGTMFGLESQLILRKIDINDGLSPIRSVIIPIGEVRTARNGHHTTITVDTKFQRRVRFHRYHIDTTLGRLVGSVALDCELYKVHLHAVSSHCLPDPLTGTTGTEEALLALRSARCKSFQNLDDDAMEILDKISSLTPRRVYYPIHLQVMQSTKWEENLPSTAQHDGFWIVVETIKQHAASLSVFQRPGCCSDSGALPLIPLLLDRAARRNAIYYPPELTDIVSSDSGDLVYVSQDLLDGNHDDEGEQMACKFSAMIHNWPLRLNTSRQLWDTLTGWQEISGSQSTSLTMSYRRHWMEQGLNEVWVTLYDLCRNGGTRYEVMFSLCSMAYGPNRLEVHDLIPTILAFATLPQFRSIHPPPWSSYDLSKGVYPKRQELSQLARECAIAMEQSPASHIQRNYRETDPSYEHRRQSSYQDSLSSETTQIVDFLMAQWPCPTPTFPSTGSFKFIDTNILMGRAIPLFRSWSSNADLHEHILAVQNVLDQSFQPISNSPPKYSFTPCTIATIGTAPFSPLSRLTLRHLLQRNTPKAGSLPDILRAPSASPALQSLISEFQSSSDRFPRRYGEGLMKSLEALHTSSPHPRKEYSIVEVVLHYEKCRAYVQEVFASILSALSPSTPIEKVVFTSHLWPRITRRSVLALLATTCGISLTTPWKDILSVFAMALLLYQRSQRILGCALLGKKEDVWRELENVGCFDRDSALNVDWLLIQIDGDFLARPVQIQIAKEMLDPPSSRNTVLQLNMGEGKSSVIVPMVATSLADGTKLTRIVVLKALANQMFQLLVERLSGLTNRQIFYMPFSRSLRVGSRQVQHIQDLYEHCLRVNGVLVVQPEHILSFKLMGVDMGLSERSEDQAIAKQLINSQRWLERYCRDVLDESDEILAVKYQLIYSIGEQQPLEHHPDRWTTIQQVLSLVRRRAPQIQRRFPSGIEMGHLPRGGFPSVRILESEAGEALVSEIIQAVINGEISNCCFAPLPDQLRRMAGAFIGNMNVSSGESHILKKYCEDSELWKSLLLLRGLLAHGILVYALKGKRWRVDYGLDRSRSLLAVPYRAKDVPSPRAEFGHSDVAILLTCLSYFYEGLTENELDSCFQLLYKLDNPALEYACWIRANSSIPECLRQLSGVNTRDGEQRREMLIPHFRQNHAVVNFYLSQVVFPKAAKEFPQKLTASSWDLAEVKHHLTTGFSGTNDNQYLLPTSVSQRDPPGQLSTNAKVLSYLLQPENDCYLCPQTWPGEMMSGEQLLEVIVAQTPDIRVVLDVGAQILDLTNDEFVTHWLRLRPDVPAAIFFNEKDNLVVATQDGGTESFITSSFNSQLDKCLVYLDDAHTRGTDLKLPRDYRAAVTLGPKVTKDRLTQGCMRLRKLGFGQSVMFIAPLEVDRKIREAAGAAHGKTSGPVRSIDVLRWAMLETCADIKHHVPHWAQQGLDYDRRHKAWSKLSSTDSSSSDIKETWLQREANTLDAMYGVPGSDDTHSSDSPLSELALQIPKIRERCELLGVTSFSHMRTEEEQEREVAHEIEREQQVQLPPKAVAAKHSIHPDVRYLVSDGVIRQSSPAFCCAFPPLREAAGSQTELSHDGWSQELLVTRDFIQTIDISESSHYLGDYLRPVQWIISSTHGSSKVLVIVSPYEVNELLPKILQSRKVHLHLYTPRVTQEMKPVDHLRLYSIPTIPTSWVSPDPILLAQLNLCAGQLYLANQRAYLQLCEFLGIYTQEIQQAGGVEWQSDGFIKREHRRALTDRANSPFTHSPLPYLKELIGLRRKGMTYAPTHLGKVLHARFLSEEDF